MYAIFKVPFVARNYLRICTIILTKYPLYWAFTVVESNFPEDFENIYDVVRIGELYQFLSNIFTELFPGFAKNGNALILTSQKSTFTIRNWIFSYGGVTLIQWEANPPTTDGPINGQGQHPCTQSRHIQTKQLIPYTAIIYLKRKLYWNHTASLISKHFPIDQPDVDI